MKNIIFDFDGVIIDSMHIRSFGFQEIFKTFDKNDVDKLVLYHNENAGLSRFVKIKYFFNEMLKKDISDDDINIFAIEYSKIMRSRLIGKDIIIDEAIRFIKEQHNIYNLHIASGSEQEELRYLNKTLEIDKYFKSIYGSPTSKIKLVENIIKENNYNKYETILIGDAINDYEAAKQNDIIFLGYNNKRLQNISDYYIESFKIFADKYKATK